MELCAESYVLIDWYSSSLLSFLRAITLLGQRIRYESSLAVAEHQRSEGGEAHCCQAGLPALVSNPPICMSLGVPKIRSTALEASPGLMPPIRVQSIAGFCPFGILCQRPSL